jgi:tRNA (mo5U34)-methyltransferase
VTPAFVTHAAGDGRQALVDEVAAVGAWFHSIDLGGGIVTPGVKSRQTLERELAALRLPDLRGRSVLDIGAWDGFFAFACERAGAERVVALDHFAWAVDWSRQPGYIAECRRRGERPLPYREVPELWRPGELPGKRGFDLARRALGSGVEPVVGDFLEMDAGVLGRFDVVLLLGVLYHLESPLEGLRHAAAHTGDLLVVETEAVVAPGLEDRAICEFFWSDRLAEDPTNWWSFNERAILDLCLAAGLRRAERVAPRRSAARRLARRARRAAWRLGRRPHRGRAVVHARR